MQKTKAEIVDYVVDYFKTHPRATTEIIGCMYQTSEGNRCAHSICLSEEGLVLVIKNNLNHNSTAADVIRNLTDEVHKEEFRGHSARFWNEVQDFHDDSYNWIDDSEGGNILSEDGVKRANKLKEFTK